MKWQTKALIQRFLSRTPCGARVYNIAQKRVGGLRKFQIGPKTDQGRRLLDSFSEVGEAVAGYNTVEIGTGAAPVVPILFWLNGHRQCHTYDINRLLEPSLVIQVAQQFSESSISGSVVAGERRTFDERLKLLRLWVQQRASAAEILSGCNVHYRAPSDAAQTGLSPETIDCVYSNTVLEHVREDEIKSLFTEARRILRPGGFMLHLIDLSDHFSHDDPGISSIHFLRFSEARFAKYNTKFLFQNRLRESAWRVLFTSAGFEILLWKTVIDDRAMREAANLDISHEFMHLPREELCTSSLCVVAKRP
jgi:SAM-dependent methyltransferase